MSHVTFWPRFIDRAHLGRLKRSSQCKIGLIKDYYYDFVADPCSRRRGFANPHRHSKNGPDVGGRSVEWQEMRGGARQAQISSGLKWCRLGQFRSPWPCRARGGWRRTCWGRCPGRSSLRAQGCHPRQTLAINAVIMRRRSWRSPRITWTSCRWPPL